MTVKNNENVADMQVHFPLCVYICINCYGLETFLWQ